METYTEEDRLRRKHINLELLKRHSNNIERRNYVRALVTPELLKELIEERRYSVWHIQKEILEPLGIDRAPIQTICKENGIKTPSIKESASSAHVREKYKKTCVTRYGAENVLSRGTIPFQNRNETVQNRYGVSNVFANKDIKEKIIDTTIKKYGVRHIAHLPNSHHTCGRKSKIHRKVETFLSDVDVPFTSEVGGKFVAFNTYLKRIYSPIVDILLNEQKKIIEIYGDRWHANPNIYKETDLIKMFRGHLSAKEIREKDAARIEQLKGCGYNVLVIWETDIQKNEDEVRKLLYEYCKN
jgi:very-short-patch-repair endonuclease